ncbi:GNAT family protein [Salegentibacter maritimus]|uniref:GNAT family N-acetyltransferase n=1 Tax=Salegentibacter maritimus TaxID=2794347 RepID=A0ABS0TG54_9FLAO|nr:GNAT family N-acetyltransferase [Salegentibacter maritimus]MBI6119770.1 GNAT family N-acetyltransferase [Salegentibacter maritimus]
MLKFREIDYKKDIPAVVQLINEGLDDTFTESFFRWKHVQNPFGKSFGFLIEDDGSIVGLRMFMFWKFKKSKEYKTAIRPVDTVVDKRYRGKGLFKKMNLVGIEMCKGKYDVIFNTPNHNSLPGNLKMGWNILEDSPKVKMGLLNPFSKKKEIEKIEKGSFNLKRNYESSSLMWQTNKTGEFLKWRYEDKKYILVQYADSFMIFSLKKIKGLKTIIIYELLGDSKQFQTMINATAKREKSFFIYFVDNKEFERVNCIASTVRKNANVVFKSDSGNIQKNINFSLGDLESKL